MKNNMKSKVTLKNLIRITAGGRHAWYETTDGFNVKKPLGAEGTGRLGYVEIGYRETEKGPELLEVSMPSGVTEAMIEKEMGEMIPSWWQKVVVWFKRLWT